MKNTYTAVSPAEYRQYRGQIRRGTQILMDTILFVCKAQGRKVSNAGIVNDRNQRGGTAKSLHAVGRAGDVHIVNRADGDYLFRQLVAAADVIGLDEVIWNRQRWDATSGKVKRYLGVNPHTDHVHFALDQSVADYSGNRDDLVRWFAACIFHI